MGYVTGCLRNRTAGLKQIKAGLPNERADVTLCGGQSGWEIMQQRGCGARRLGMIVPVGVAVAMLMRMIVLVCVGRAVHGGHSGTL